jgi:hypothetical protein
MKKYSLLLIFPLLLLASVQAVKVPEREFYELRIYHLKNDAQEKRVDAFLKTALVPALHRAGLSKIGVFKPADRDTASLKIYVLIPYASLSDVTKVQETLNKDKSYLTAGSDYLDTRFDNTAFSRLESIFIHAFSHNPKLQLPSLKGPRDQRIYELRSYEGHSEKIFRNKVHMFNEGGEVALFKRLGFNAVFYGDVIAGSRMPNLMYMTTFENKASRDEHWKTFSDDPEWKKLSSMPEYKNNVSKIDIFFLRPTEYSDY